MKNRTARTSWLFAGLTAAMWIAGGATAAAQPNAIQIENAKAGSSDWLLTKVKRHDDEIYELGWHRRKGIRPAHPADHEEHPRPDDQHDPFRRALASRPFRGAK